MAVACTAVAYIVRGGLRAGVFTDALQSAAMITASFGLWGVEWVRAGGWRGLHQKLAALDPELPDRPLHVGGYSAEGVPPILVAIGFVVVLSGRRRTWGWRRTCCSDCSGRPNE